VAGIMLQRWETPTLYLWDCELATAEITEKSVNFKHYNNCDKKSANF